HVVANEFPGRSTSDGGPKVLPELFRRLPPPSGPEWLASNLLDPIACPHQSCTVDLQNIAPKVKESDELRHAIQNCGQSPMFEDLGGSTLRESHPCSLSSVESRPVPSCDS